MSIQLQMPTIVDLLLLADSALPEERQQYEALEGRPWDVESVAIEAFSKEGVKYGLFDTDAERVIVAGGFELVVPGVWQTWMIGTPENWVQHWRSITKYSRRAIDELLNGGARRVQTCVLASREKACEWYCRGLKMQLEGTLRNFGVQGEAMQMYARVGSSHVLQG